MRTIITLLLCSLFLAPFLHADETPTEFMGKWVESFNKNDAKLMTSFYDDSEEIDVLVSNGSWFRGHNRLKEMYAQDMKEVVFYDSKAERMKSRIVGDIAVVSFIHQFKYEVKSLAVKYRIHIRTTATLKKHAKSWKIISEHSSAIKGIERAEEVEGKEETKLKHLILPDAPTKKVAKLLLNKEIEGVLFKDLTWQQAVKYINQQASGKPDGELLSPILFGDDDKIGLKKLISISNESTNFAACLEEICEQSGLKWTIYFYAGHLSHPMLVVGEEEVILANKSAKDNYKPKR